MSHKIIYLLERYFKNLIQKRRGTISCKIRSFFWINNFFRVWRNGIILRGFFTLWKFLNVCYACAFSLIYNYAHVREREFMYGRIRGCLYACRKNRYNPQWLKARGFARGNSRIEKNFLIMQLFLKTAEKQLTHIDEWVIMIMLCNLGWDGKLLKPHFASGLRNPVRKPTEDNFHWQTWRLDLCD